jgi:hypothetical protein
VIVRDYELTGWTKAVRRSAALKIANRVALKQSAEKESIPNRIPCSRGQLLWRICNNLYLAPYSVQEKDCDADINVRLRELEDKIGIRGAVGGQQMHLLAKPNAPGNLNAV